MNTEREYRSWAIVRARCVAFHRWPSAPAGRDYLGHLHRHEFHVEARVATKHNDREIEFHDLQDLLRSLLPAHGTHLGQESCEDIAAKIGRDLRQHYPRRAVIVSVFEDGESGAELWWEA